MRSYSSIEFGRRSRAAYDRAVAARLNRLGHKPSGVPDIAVVYVYPMGGGAYDEAARRFVATYREFPPLADHTLHVVLNGEVSPGDDSAAVFAGLPCEFHTHDDSGWDIGAFQMAARTIECDVLVCLGGNTYFRRAGWLERMSAAFRLHGNGLYGASASYEVTPHIRTTGFWCSPELIRAYPIDVCTYEDRYDFEHGDLSITRLAEHLGLGCWMVTWDGVYAQDEWRTPPNIFWRGDQSGCLVYDRLHDLYGAERLAGPLLDARADGWGVEAGARGLGRTKSEWLAQDDSDSARAEELLTVSGSWTFLARELLKSLEESAGDEASRIRIQKEFVA
ncbi:MAG: hypothetical protein Q8K82_12685, partial [Gemmatimonadaceae bacterium]|nr:hypothetical protein [Gemmatimonadaceae bacterium]